MSNASNMFSEYFRSLTILHLALMLGQVVLALVAYFIFNTDKEPLFGVAATGQNLVYIAGGITILGVLAGAQLFGMKMKSLREVKDFQEKLAGYRLASILRYALLEAPSLIAIFLYMQSNNLLLLIFTILILLLFIVYRPTKDRLIADLELSPSEQALL